MNLKKNYLVEEIVLYSCPKENQFELECSTHWYLKSDRQEMIFPTLRLVLQQLYVHELNHDQPSIPSSTFSPRNLLFTGALSFVKRDQGFFLFLPSSRPTITSSSTSSEKIKWNGLKQSSTEMFDESSSLGKSLNDLENSR